MTALLQTGAKQLIHSAVETELQLLMENYSTQQTETGHAAVVRNGYQPARQIETGIGPVTVRIPKVRSRTGEAVTFRSALMPPYIGKTKSLESVQSQTILTGYLAGTDPSGCAQSL